MYNTEVSTETELMSITVLEIDFYFSEFIRDLSPDNRELMYFTALLLSHLRSEGHVCLQLRAWAAKKVNFRYLWINHSSESESPDEYEYPSYETWNEVLSCSEIVGNLLQPNRPLIVEDDRLYLQRYWNYELKLAEKLKELNLDCDSIPAEHLTPDQTVTCLMTDHQEKDDGYGKAAILALRSHLLIISGGPGTGKTSSVASILYRLLKTQPEMKISLTAPTGKAAARMNEAIESIRKSMQQQPELDQTIIERIPANAMTIHRLLETIPYSVTFRRQASNPLDADLVVADEASMIDMALMSKLCAALKKGSRLILLGDDRQLSSVEAGSAFGDLCDVNQVAMNGKTSVLAEHIIHFTHSRRFPESSSIYQLSQLINQGQGEEAMRYLDDLAKDNPDPMIRTQWLSAESPLEFKELIARHVIDGFRPYLEADTPSAALALFNSFRILAVLREGRWGVDDLNRLSENILQGQKLITTGTGWYENRPIIILKNNYQLNLFNGDVGIVRSNSQGLKRVYVPTYHGEEIREFIPAVLPQHQSVYAMTVHKSQGAEFTMVVLVLPEADCPILNRELLYTAVTRIRQKIVIIGSRDAFLQAVHRKTERGSGLAARFQV